MTATMNVRYSIPMVNTLENWWWPISQGEVASPV